MEALTMTKHNPNEPTDRSPRPSILPSGLTTVGEILRLQGQPLRERLALAGDDAVEWFDRTNEELVYLRSKLDGLIKASDKALRAIHDALETHEDWNEKTADYRRRGFPS